MKKNTTGCVRVCFKQLYALCNRGEPWKCQCGKWWLKWDASILLPCQKQTHTDVKSQFQQYQAVYLLQIKKGLRLLFGFFIQFPSAFACKSLSYKLLNILEEAICIFTSFTLQLFFPLNDDRLQQPISSSDMMTPCVLRCRNFTLMCLSFIFTNAEIDWGGKVLWQLLQAFLMSVCTF